MGIKRKWRVVENDVNTGKQIWVSELKESADPALFFKCGMDFFACMSARQGGLMQVMYAIVRELHKEGYGRRHVSLKEEDCGLKKSAFYKHISTLVECGILFRTDSSNIYEVNREYLAYGREKRKRIRDADKG